MRTIFIPALRNLAIISTLLVLGPGISKARDAINTNCRDDTCSTVIPLRTMFNVQLQCQHLITYDLVERNSNATADKTNKLSSCDTRIQEPYLSFLQKDHARKKYRRKRASKSAKLNLPKKEERGTYHSSEVL